MNEKRITAGIIDFFISAIIQSIIMFSTIFIPMILFQNKTGINNIVIKVIIITLISMSYLIFRDILGIKSIGKIIMKIKITDLNGNNVTFIQRLIRNLTWLFGPIEIFVLLITKYDYRIGDKIAKTKIDIV